MKADEEDKLFHTAGAWWTFLKSGKWNGENDYTLFVEFVDLMFTALTQGRVDWEKRPMFIKDQDEKIARIQKSMILLGNEMERHPFSDILGSLHQELSSLSHRSSLGSFYTPDSVCQMCAGTVNSADLRRKIENGKTVLWASCECTNFSRAKGGKPRDPDSRSLAEHLYRYIEALEPDYIQIENVTEFLEWGPLIEQDGQLMPDPDRKGDSFREWFSHIEGMGYKGGWRIFNSADFGAYTSRTRLFIQFARIGFALAWPKPTHRRENWKACREVLDLTDFGKSIFTRKKPLCDNTLRRLTEGIRKFANPQFVFRYMTGPGHVHSPEKPCVTLCTQKNLYLAAGKFMTRYFSGKGHNTSLDGPCGTLTTIPHQYPVTVTFMDNYFGNGYPTSIDEPCGTLCTKQQRFPVTAVFLANYYSGGGQLASTESPCPTLTTNPKPRVVRCQFLDQQYSQSGPASLDCPFPTITTNLHHGVVTASYIRAMMRPRAKGLVHSVDEPMKTLLTRDYFYLDTCRYSYMGCPVYNQPAPGDTAAMLELKSAMRERGIADIYMRPISVRESLRVMGFPEDYRLCGTQTQQRKWIGNAVEVKMARNMAQALADSMPGAVEVHGRQMAFEFRKETA